jgi:ankyrin repeat protein
MKKTICVLWLISLLTGCAAARGPIGAADFEKLIGEVKGQSGRIKRLAELLGHERYRVRELAVEEILKVGAPALARLTEARASGDLEISERARGLMDKITAKVELKHKAMQEALESGKLDAVKKLVEDDPALVDALLWESSTCLHTAVASGHESIVAFLLEKGAVASPRDAQGQTPLHLTTSEKVAKLLISHGADMDAKDSSGNTPLWTAMHGDRGDIALLLITMGADVNVKGQDGSAPIHMAVLKEDIQLCKLICESTADVNARDGRKRTAIDIARRHKSREIVQLLLKHGGMSGNDYVNLVSAAEAGDVEKLKKYAAGPNVDINAKNSRGQTLLHWAALNGCNDVAAFAVENHRRPGAASHRGGKRAHGDCQAPAGETRDCGCEGYVRAHRVAQVGLLGS